MAKEPKADAVYVPAAPTIKAGTKVKWTTSSGAQGSGRVINNETSGHVLVAVDNSQPGQEHRVIYCATSWLTLI